jgi:hypothetical protein
MRRFLPARQNDGGIGDSTINTDFGFVQKCPVIPSIDLTDQSGMLDLEDFPSVRNRCRIKVLQVSTFSKRSRPVLHSMLPANLLNLVQAQRNECLIIPSVEMSLP